MYAGLDVGSRTIKLVTFDTVIGVRYLFPDCRTILDIGGQDSEVIQLSESGEVQKFEMNDRCAAGTGKFLEIMANTLEVGVAEIGDLALGATKELRINSLCSVR